MSILRGRAAEGAERPTRRSAWAATWAATGAAIAVSIGALAPSMTNTASAVLTTGERAVFVPITPCRLADTRPAHNVGVAAQPLSAGSTTTVEVLNAPGPCPATIRADAVGLTLNVTAVGATAPTFLTIWGDGTLPLAASLNPSPGQPPTPNAVNVKLSQNGSFKIFNRAGDVDVVVDVVGFHVDHNHDDRYHTKPVTEFLINDRLPRQMSASLFLPCRADSTGDGDARAGQFDVCATLLLDEQRSFRGFITAELGWAAVGAPSWGHCRLTLNGSPAGVREVRMGERVDTTDSDHLHHVTLTEWVGNVQGPVDVGVECGEGVGDIDWMTITLSYDFDVLPN